MKPPLLASFSIAIAFSFFLVACDQEDQAANQTPVSQTTAELAREAEFTPWMSRAGLQMRSEQCRDGHYFSTVEGRLKNGENQYRAIVSTLELGKISNAWAQWGLSANDLFDWELRLLKMGAERAESQVFTDSTGQAIHQLVMVLPKDSSTALAESSEPVFESVPDTVELPLIDPNAEVVEFDPDFATSGEAGPESVVEPEVATGPGELVVDSGSTSPGSTVDEAIRSDQPPGGEAGGGDLEEAIGAIETPDLPDIEEPGIAILVDDPEADLETETEVAEPEPIPATRMLTYKVVGGDNLSRISRRFKVSVKDIKEANGLKSDLLKVNQVLKIPSQP